ncbi:hypothetical protein BHM03_00044610 [Ensete ventricosum]|nr:hypothetical protein BHM03_00044610 [Ensete ventricosum]
MESTVGPILARSSSAPRAFRSHRVLFVNGCKPNTRPLPPTFSLRLLLLKAEGNDGGDQFEADDDGAAGGANAAPEALELKPGSGGAAVPHAERVLLPAQRVAGVLRRSGAAVGAGAGASAVLPDGRAAGAGGGRAGGDRLQRGGRAVRGGGGARRHSGRLRGLRAHHGDEEVDPACGLHRRHLFLPAAGTAGLYSSHSFPHGISSYHFNRVLPS